MAKRRYTVDEIVHEVQRAARERLIARTDVGTEEVAASWAPVLEQLRDRIVAHPEELREAIAEAQRDMARSALRPAQRSIRAGVQIGVRAAEQQHARLTGPEGPVRATARQVASSAPTMTSERAQEMGRARIAGTSTRDGVRLSTRLHTRTREAAQHAERVVRSSIDARTGIFEASEEFLRDAGAQMRIAQPRYVQRIVREARRARDTGDRTRLLQVIEGHTNEMNRLGEGASRRDGMYSIRSSVRQFVNDVQARPEDIERLLDRHMRERAQFQARRIIRHETAEAMRASYLESVQGQPYTMGIRWVLSPAHPRPDICDLYARQALHGLGPGGYPDNGVPETPHPMCLCSHEAIIDRHHFRRQRAIRLGEAEPPRPWEDPNIQTAHGWLAEQPDGFRRQLLGPTRVRIFDTSEAGRRAVIDDRGRPIPVAEALASWARRER